MARILIVDDEADVREFLRLGLERVGHQVFEADDGTTALHTPALNEVDLIVTDLIMPSPGTGFVQAVRQRGLRTPIVVISAYLRPDDWGRVGEGGVDAFLEKPIPLEQLRTVVDDLLTP